jgi:P-type Mg2+ transporter
MDKKLDAKITKHGLQKFTSNQHLQAKSNIDDYWTKSAAVLLEELKSNVQGLSEKEASGKMAVYGSNSLTATKNVGPLGIFLGQFKSPIILILLIATTISFFLNEIVDAIIILAIVLGSALLSFFQEYSANAAADKLKSQVRINTKVLRNNQEISVPVEMVVPGDIVLLSAGSLITADGIVIESRDFYINQAVLTGETFPVEKTPESTPAQTSLSERTNCVYMGTSVSSGSARALIVNTGNSTEYGQIAQQLVLHSPENEFERGLRHFGLLLSQIMLFLVLGIFVFNMIFQRPVLDSLLFSIALAVGLTPQLLPAIININLSKGSQVMAKSGVIVRKLSAIENFGSMDILCTDKTGTLTLGVVKLDGALDVDGASSDDVMLLASLNSSFQTGMSNPLDDAITSIPVKGLNSYQKTDEIPYDFHRKRLSIIVSKDSKDIMITKGALESILDICSHFQKGPRAIKFNAEIKAKIQSKYEEWSSKGYRILGVATKDKTEKRRYNRDDETGMVFKGFLLFMDPPKPDVKKTIEDLEALKITLKVITGDNHLVAAHMAQTIGLEITGIVTGKEMMNMRDEALWHLVEKANIFTEVDPNQKERLIRAFQKRGHVVGYMGDGVNDAPALHAADVRISVDSAVDVAKEAADFVLMKHDLAVLQKGIIEGRRTFANTLKYVFMATSANFGNMFSVAGASLFLPFLPMLPKQILLINFLTDLPEMTIATDRVDDDYIQTPHRWDIKFIRRFMLAFGLLSSIFDYLTFAVLIWLFKASPAQFQTGWFVESILSASLVVFAIRTKLPFMKSKPSKYMLLMTSVVCLITLIIPFSPLSGLMEFQPLPLSYIGIIFLIVITYFLCAELLKKWFFRNNNNSN